MPALARKPAARSSSTLTWPRRMWRLRRCTASRSTDWDTVILESRRALDLNPSLDMPHLYLAVAYFHIGLLDEAESAGQGGARAEPGKPG